MARLVREMPTTFMPNALKRGAIASAIAPKPRMPTVLPSSVMPGQRSHFCSPRWRSMRRMSRLKASIIRNAISDIGTPWMPRVAVTMTSLPR